MLQLPNTSQLDITKVGVRREENGVTITFEGEDFIVFKDKAISMSGLTTDQFLQLMSLSMEMEKIKIGAINNETK